MRPHTGDLLFNGTFPVIDYSTGGWIGGMAQASAHTMLATIYERLEPMVKAGKTVEEAVRKPDAFVQVAYTSILRHMKK